MYVSSNMDVFSPPVVTIIDVFAINLAHPFFTYVTSGNSIFAFLLPFRLKMFPSKWNSKKTVSKLKKKIKVSNR